MAAIPAEDDVKLSVDELTTRWIQLLLHGIVLGDDVKTSDLRSKLSVQKKLFNSQMKERFTMVQKVMLITAVDEFMKVNAELEEAMFFSGKDTEQLGILDDILAKLWVAREMLVFAEKTAESNIAHEAILRTPALANLLDIARSAQKAAVPTVPTMELISEEVIATGAEATEPIQISALGAGVGVKTATATVPF